MMHTTRATQAEKWIPVLAGGSLIAYGLGMRSKAGAGLALLGSGFIYAGVRRSDAVTRIQGDRGIRVEKAVTIMRSADDLYNYWRRLENLSRFMQHLESVEQTGEYTSHWVAKAPAGRTVEWDAEIVAEEPGRYINWRSLPGSDIENFGSVEFRAGTGGRGTVVTVKLEYDPPGGLLGRGFAMLWGEEPSLQVTDDLRRFKQLMETGEVTTTEGQPAAR